MKTAQLLEAFSRLEVLVVGDLCLDHWCTYDPTLSEPSRETGIPRVAVTSRVLTPGAAGTIANNLVALGVGSVTMLSAIGDDGFGWELSRALIERGTGADLLVRTPLLPTFTYTKLLNAQTGAEDRPRVDFVHAGDVPEEIETELVSRLREHGPHFPVIIVSDQAETPRGGLVTARVRETLADLARENPQQVIWVDSRVRAEHFRGVIVKPNEEEANAAAERVCGRRDLPALQTQIGGPALVVTRGPLGADVYSAGGRFAVPTRVVGQPVDICGAGDSFSAGAAPAWCLTRDAATAVRLGNLVASITIMKPGTGTASPAEVLEAESQWH
jgi:rfaE bifunctional protein kinase chain/domain